MAVRKRYWLTDSKVAAWAERNGMPLAEAKAATRVALKTVGERAKASKVEKDKARALLAAAGAGESWLVDYRAPSGKRVVESFDSYKGAKDRDATVHTEIKKGAFVQIDGKASVAEAGERWIRNCEAEQLRPVTLKQYRSHLRIHIVPRLGDMRLGKMTSGHCEAFRDWLLNDAVSKRKGGNKRLSPAMAAKVWVSFGSLLRASRVGHLVDGIALTAPAAPELQPGVDLPTLDEMPRIIRAAEPGRQRLMVMLLANCAPCAGRTSPVALFR